jgi:hypothetical protein
MDNASALPSPRFEMKEIMLDFKSHAEVATWADFTYHITPDTIAIIDTGKGPAFGDRRHRDRFAPDRILTSGIHRQIRNHLPR